MSDAIGGTCTCHGGMVAGRDAPLGPCPIHPPDNRPDSSTSGEGGEEHPTEDEYREAMMSMEPPRDPGVHGPADAAPTEREENPREWSDAELANELEVGGEGPTYAARCEAARRLRGRGEGEESGAAVLRRLLLIPPMGEADFEQALMAGAAKLRVSDHPRADDWADMLSDLWARIVAALDEEGD